MKTPTLPVYGMVPRELVDSFSCKFPKPNFVCVVRVARRWNPTAEHHLYCKNVNPRFLSAARLFHETYRFVLPKSCLRRSKVAEATRLQALLLASDIETNGKRHQFCTVETSLNHQPPPLHLHLETNCR